MKAQILVIDDDDEFCEELRSLLEDLGFCVSAVLSAEEGEGLLASRFFHAVILDYKMTGMSGIELLTRMDGETRKKVLLLSGQMSIETRLEEAGLTGAIGGLMNKPVDFPRLMEWLKGVEEKAISAGF